MTIRAVLVTPILAQGTDVHFMMSSSISFSKVLDKQEWSNASTRKEIVKMIAQINEIETEKSNKQKKTQYNQWIEELVLPKDKQKRKTHSHYQKYNKQKK